MTRDELHLILERAVVDWLREYELSANAVMRRGGRVPAPRHAIETAGGCVAVLHANAVSMAMLRYDFINMLAATNPRAPLPPLSRLQAEQHARTCATDAMAKIGW